MGRLLKRGRLGMCASDVLCWGEVVGVVKGGISRKEAGVMVLKGAVCFAQSMFCYFLISEKR